MRKHGGPPNVMVKMWNHLHMMLRQWYFSFEKLINIKFYDNHVWLWSMVDIGT